MNDETREEQDFKPLLEAQAPSEMPEALPLNPLSPEEMLEAEQEREKAAAKKAADKVESDAQAAKEALAATTTFHLLPEVFSLMRLPVQIKQLPDFIWQSSFFTLSRSPDEISVVCEERLVVRNIDHYGLGNVARIDGNWRILRLGVMDLSLVGIAARFSGILAEAGVNINIISTYDTDYVMVKQAKLARALTALREAGYEVK
jgi:uncharacterized protein